MAGQSGIFWLAWLQVAKMFSKLKNMKIEKYDS